MATKVVTCSVNSSQVKNRLKYWRDKLKRAGSNQLPTSVTNLQVRINQCYLVEQANLTPSPPKTSTTSMKNKMLVVIKWCSNLTLFTSKKWLLIKSKKAQVAGKRFYTTNIDCSSIKLRQLRTVNDRPDLCLYICSIALRSASMCLICITTIWCKRIVWERTLVKPVRMRCLNIISRLVRMPNNKYWVPS